MRKFSIAINRVKLIVFLFVQILWFVKIHGQTPVFNEKNRNELLARFNALKPYFLEAYRQYPNLPVGILEAVSFEMSRWRHIIPENEEPSCVGLPPSYGLFGLTDDPSGYFKNNLQYVSDLTGIPVEDLKYKPEAQIRAYAQILSKELQNTNGRIEPLIVVNKTIRKLSELPEPTTPLEQYAQDVFAYHVFRLLEDPFFMTSLGYTPYRVPWKVLFDSVNLEILRRGRVNVNPSEGTVSTPSGLSYRLLAGPSCTNVPQYPPAIWDPADPSNYSSRTTNPTHIAIHTIQGRYASAINWFKNPSANVSAHYVISSWGEVTQMVCEEDKAWHVGTENNYTIGYEHEGWVSDPVWYTDTMYGTSAYLTRDVCQDWNIPRIRVAWFPWAATTEYASASRPGACVRIKGHQHYPNQTHTDPGANWDWEFYFRKINGLPSNITVYTSSTGTFYDSGGPTGNYGDDEFLGWVIDPPGDDPVVLTFSQFDLEVDAGGYPWDYMYIWDGTGPDGRFIGYFYGTNSPGTVIGYSGALYIEFRSDCATNRPGWAASWSTMTPSCPAPKNLTLLQIQPLAALVSWNAVPGAVSYTVRYKRSYYTSWTYLTTTDTIVWITGLAASAHYDVQVNAHCSSTDSSGWVGKNFSTLPASGSWTVSSCSGIFADAGGPVDNYLNNENWTYTIQSPNGNPITVSFSQFSTEQNYDFLYIYDGPSTASPLIGTYHGTTSPGTITSSGSSITFRFTSDGATRDAGWLATWSVSGCSTTPPPPPPPPSNPPRPTTMVQSPASGWITSDFVAYFNDSGPYKERFYLVTDSSTAWGANTSRGFLYDDFTTNSGAWTVYSGNWQFTSNGTLVQTDEGNSNTNIYIPVDQNLSPIILYRWRARISGSGTNKRAGLHFFADNANTANRNNSYFVYFREDHDKVQIYKVVNDTWTLVEDTPYTINNNQWYIFSVVFNTTTGQIDVYIDTLLVATWQDPNPHAVGNYISPRSGNCIYEIDWIEVWKYRSGGGVLVEVGPTKDMRYESPYHYAIVGRVHTIVTDSFGRLSDPNSVGYWVDFTPPITAPVRDGLSADIDTTSNNTSLSANWDSFTDPNSPVIYYEYSVGTVPGDSSVIPWTQTTNTSFTQTGLSLTPGQTYYVNVRAYNEAGLRSPIVSSDGLMVLSLTVPSTVINVPGAWVTQDFNASFFDYDQEQVQWRFYQVASKISDTRWQANTSFGFLEENFDTSALPSQWTVYSGNWQIVNNKWLIQLDEANSNTAFSVPVDQNISAPILYHWRAKIEGSGTNKRAGLHIFASDPASNRGNSYLIYFREDDDIIQVVKSVNDTLIFPSQVWEPFTINYGQWYDFKVIYDPQTGWILIFVDDTLRASWQDPNPLNTGGNYVSLRSGNAIYTVDFIRIYRGRPDTNVLITVGPGAELFTQNASPFDPAGKIRSIVMDTTELLSVIAEILLNVDWTAPYPIGAPSDITPYDRDTIYVTDSLPVTIYWNDFYEPNSAIDYYEVCLGIAPGDSSVLPWTQTTSTFYQWTNVNLDTNTYYYASVRAVNTAGLRSWVSISDGFVIVNKPKSQDTVSQDTTIISVEFPVAENKGNIVAQIVSTHEGKQIKIKTQESMDLIINLTDALGRTLFTWQGTVYGEAYLPLPKNVPHQIVLVRIVDQEGSIEPIVLKTAIEP